MGNTREKNGDIFMSPFCLGKSVRKVDISPVYNRIKGRRGLGLHWRKKNETYVLLIIKRRHRFDLQKILKEIGSVYKRVKRET